MQKRPPSTQGLRRLETFVSAPTVGAGGPLAAEVRALWDPYPGQVMSMVLCWSTIPDQCPMSG
jgi:hypothetical protein